MPTLAMLCPLCKAGRLTYPIDQARGRCMACYITTNRIRPKVFPPTQIWGNPQGRFVQENADHDPEDGTLYWEPEDERFG